MTEPIEYGIASRALAGETASGDAYVVHAFEGGVVCGVIDGLGHGEEASEASRIAAESIASHATESVDGILRHCHEELRGTRGAVMSLASFSTAESRMSWVGVGNVEALLYRKMRKRQAILLRGGVVGYQIPPIRTAWHDVQVNDLLVMATDGIRSDFAESVDMDTAVQDSAEEILDLFAKDSDDALVLVVRWLGGRA